MAGLCAPRSDSKGSRSARPLSWAPFVSPFTSAPLPSKPAPAAKAARAAVKRGSENMESSELSSSSNSSSSTGDADTPQQPRNLLVAIDNSEDADYSVAWTIDHLYRPGDKLHLLHCISRIPRDRDFTRKADGTGLETSVPPALIDAVVGGPREEVLRRHWETREAVRRRFEANVSAKGGSGGEPRLRCRGRDAPEANHGSAEPLWGA